MKVRSSTNRFTLRECQQPLVTLSFFCSRVYLHLEDRTNNHEGYGPHGYFFSALLLILFATF
jgi:hypothetical protein